MRVTKIWWRRLTGNDLFNIEKPLKSGPKGQLHIDVPKFETLRALLSDPSIAKGVEWYPKSINVRVRRDQSVTAPLTFWPRMSNNRYHIRNQNRNSVSSERHPAWTAKYGWPFPEDSITSTAIGNDFLAKTPVVIVIIRDDGGNFYADFVLNDVSISAWPIELRSVFFDKSSVGTIEFDEPIELVDASVQSVVEDIADTGVEIVDLAELGLDEDTGGGRRRGRGQGFGLTAAERKVVERCAVELAIDVLGEAGFTNIEDVGDFESFDLRMAKDGDVYIAEVKGTTTSGEKIILTRNEVAVHDQLFPLNALVVVSGIILKKGAEPSASGGVATVTTPWLIDKESLSPLAYEYVVNSDS